MAGMLLRGEDNRVGFAELFHDLVFVFAITQISHHLLYHYDVLGATQTALLFLAVWWVWVYSTWVINRLDPEKPAVRGLLFGLMAAGLFLSMAIPEAFGDRGTVFAAAYVSMQLGRTLFMYVAAKSNDVLRSTYRRIFLWLGVAGLFWIAGSLMPPDLRLWFWAVALAVEYLGPAVNFAVPGMGRDGTRDWAVRGGHIAERFGLFVIICLGETLLVSGATFAAKDWDAAGVCAFLASVAGTIAMWWVYFHVGYRRGTHQIETSDDPGRLARLAYTYAHLPIVAGILLAAVGSERAIAHPHDLGTLAESASVVGGLVLFLIGNGIFKRISARWFPLSHLAGLGLCLVLAAAGPWLSLLVLNAAAAAILVLVAVWEDVSLGRHPVPGH